MKKENYEIYQRKSIFSDKLKDYCSFAKEHDYIELTEWKNGEGVDIDIFSTLGTRNIQLTHGEFDLVKKLYKQLINGGS